MVACIDAFNDTIRLCTTASLVFDTCDFYSHLTSAMDSLLDTYFWLYDLHKLGLMQNRMGKRIIWVSQLQEASISGSASTRPIDVDFRIGSIARSTALISTQLYGDRRNCSSWSELQ
jgi:hypothetical protein